jgi:hypothetical protein
MLIWLVQMSPIPMFNSLDVRVTEDRGETVDLLTLVL